VGERKGRGGRKVEGRSVNSCGVFIGDEGRCGGRPGVLHVGVDGGGVTGREGGGLELNVRRDGDFVACPSGFGFGTGTEWSGREQLQSILDRRLLPKLPLAVRSVERKLPIVLVVGRNDSKSFAQAASEISRVHDAVRGGDEGVLPFVRDEGV